MVDREHPLTDNDLKEIDQRLEDLDFVDRLIVQSRNAGIDVTEQEKSAKESRAQLRKIRQSFFPGR